MYVHGSPQPLVLSDVLCGDVSHSAECFYYGLPPLLTSVGNKILVPGVVERLLWIWRPLLQRANYSFPILLLVVPRGLCSSTCVKGSWFWNKYYYTTKTGSSISTLPLESQGSASAFPEERQAAGLVVQPKCVIQSNYLIQFWWLDVKEVNKGVISDETLHFAVTWNKDKGGPHWLLSAATVSFSSDSPWCDSRQASALLRHSPWPTRSRSIPPTSTGGTPNSSFWYSQHKFTLHIRHQRSGYDFTAGVFFLIHSEHSRAPGAHFTWVFGISCWVFPKFAWVSF